MWILAHPPPRCRSPAGLIDGWRTSHRFSLAVCHLLAMADSAFTCAVGLFLWADIATQSTCECGVRLDSRPSRRPRVFLLTWRRSTSSPQGDNLSHLGGSRILLHRIHSWACQTRRSWQKATGRGNNTSLFARPKDGMGCNSITHMRELRSHIHHRDCQQCQRSRNAHQNQ